jgi:hypothetical protein
LRLHADRAGQQRRGIVPERTRAPLRRTLFKSPRALLLRRYYDARGALAKVSVILHRAAMLVKSNICFHTATEACRFKASRISELDATKKIPANLLPIARLSIVTRQSIIAGERERTGCLNVDLLRC